MPSPLAICVLPAYLLVRQIPIVLHGSLVRELSEDTVLVQLGTGQSLGTGA